MALKSRLLGGDPGLEAAAVRDAAHIVQGARGAHVGKLQQALNLIDKAGLVPDGTFGGLTARAVLAFKARRGILGPGQSTPDAIVGRGTMARLDDEMTLIERGQTPPLPPLPFPPSPPTPPPSPSGAFFSIRCESESDDPLPLIAAQPPAFFQIFDVMNDIGALYAFDVPGEVIGRPQPFSRAPRRFSTNQFFSVEKMNVPALYATRIRIDTDNRETLASTLTLRLPNAATFPVQIPMNFHIRLGIDPVSRPFDTTLSRVGVLKFREFLPSGRPRVF